MPQRLCPCSKALFNVMLFTVNVVGGSITAYAKELCMDGGHKVKMFTQYTGSA